MKIQYLIAVVAVILGFGAGVAFHFWRVEPSNRYQIVSGASGNAFRLDTQTGDTWLITPMGEETLVLPPDAQVPFDAAKSLYEELRDKKMLDTGNNPPKSLRDWAIQSNRITAKDGRKSSGIYDAAAQRSQH